MCTLAADTLKLLFLYFKYIIYKVWCWLIDRMMQISEAHPTRDVPRDQPPKFSISLRTPHTRNVLNTLCNERALGTERLGRRQTRCCRANELSIGNLLREAPARGRDDRAVRRAAALIEAAVRSLERLPRKADIKVDRVGRVLEVHGPARAEAQCEVPRRVAAQALGVGHVLHACGVGLRGDDEPLALVRAGAGPGAPLRAAGRAVRVGVEVAHEARPVVAGLLQGGGVAAVDVAGGRVHVCAVDAVEGVVVDDVPGAQTLSLVLGVADGVLVVVGWGALGCEGVLQEFDSGKGVRGVFASWKRWLIQMTRNKEVNKIKKGFTYGQWVPRSAMALAPWRYRFPVFGKWGAGWFA